MTLSTIARLYFAIGFLFGSFFMYIVGQVAKWREERRRNVRRTIQHLRNDPKVREVIKRYQEKGDY